jgi:hypothetical protein
MGLSAVGLLWALRVGSLVDDPDILWQLDDLSRLAVHWGTALLWVFVGGWITCGLLASSARYGLEACLTLPRRSCWK